MLKEHELIDKKKRLDDHYEAKSIKQNVQKQKYDKIVAGDEVKVLSYGQKGEVLEIVNDEEAIVQMGIIKMKLPIEDLEKNKKKKLSQRKWLHVKIVKQLKLNLIYEAIVMRMLLIELDQYLDQAVLSNYEQVYIIHGKSTGALQKVYNNI